MLTAPSTLALTVERSRLGALRLGWHSDWGWWYARIACCLVAASAGGQSPRSAPPDLILVGGKIFTADPAHPWAQALAIRGDRIVAVGTTKAIGALAGKGTRMLELGGRTVIPGINDAHDHVGGGTPFSVAFHASGGPKEDPLFEQVLDSLRVLVVRTPAGTWLTADIGIRVLSDTHARRAALDLVAPKHPVMLGTYTGHATILNSAALRAVGIADDARDPAGGWYERDGTNHLNGVLQEYAVWSADRAIWSALPDSVLVAALRKYSDATLRHGITSVQDMANDLDPPTTIRAHFGRQPFRSLLRSGIPIAIGSDGARNPFLNIMLAVTREENPSESITREEAVIAYTRGSAYAEFKERDKGTLVPGMLADLAVLSQDTFSVRADALPATVSVFTVVGGKPVFDAGTLHPAPF